MVHFPTGKPLHECLNVSYEPSTVCPLRALQSHSLGKQARTKSKPGSCKRQERNIEIVVNHITIIGDQLPPVSRQGVAALKRVFGYRHEETLCTFHHKPGNDHVHVLVMSEAPKTESAEVGIRGRLLFTESLQDRVRVIDMCLESIKGAVKKKKPNAMRCLPSRAWQQTCRSLSSWVDSRTLLRSVGHGCCQANCCVWNWLLHSAGPKSLNQAHQGQRPALTGRSFTMPDRRSASLTGGGSEGRGALRGALATQLGFVVLSQPQAE